MPARLNLAVGRRCFVHCAGCYTNFGQEEPILDDLVRSVASFVELGVDSVTIAGGDPLTIVGIETLLIRLREIGVRSIKLDTVGSNLIELDDDSSTPGNYRHTELMDRVLPLIDIAGIPLDGWSNEVCLRFRRGRPSIHDETVALLEIIDRRTRKPAVAINTVAHSGNIDGLERIGREVARHPCVDQWTVFQYTPTDQATDAVNRRLGVPDHRFRWEADRLRDLPDLLALGQRLECWTTASRLGQYLLVNSDLEAWIPDGEGRTVTLGSVVGRESDVLGEWRTIIAELDAPQLSRIAHPRR